MHLNQDIKNKIFFIDFPGYGTKNIFENDIFPKIFELSNCFTFIVRDSRIYEIENQTILNKALEVIKQSHKKFTVNGFIKSCFFVCNIFDNTQTDKEKDIINAKKDIKELTNVKNEEDINVCFIRALKDLDSIKNLNFFFNIEETIKEEYDKFNDYKIFYYQIYIKKSCFEEYFNDIISKKLIEIGLDNTSIDKVSTPDLNDIKNKIDNFPLGKFSPQLKEDIAKKFYIAQKYLEGKFSYEKFEIGFKKLIENTFNEMITNKKAIIQNQIDVFNKIIEQKYSEKISIESFNDLQNIKDNFINELEQLFIYIEKKWDNNLDICSEFLSNIKDYLFKTKKIIHYLLKEKDWKIIKDEIKSNILIYVEGLSLAIEKFIDDINNKILNLIIIKEKIPVWKECIKMNEITYKEFFIRNVSQRGIEISEEIKNELNRCFEDTKTQIWKNKNFISWIESCIFDEKYLNNFVDIINDAIISKINYILKLVLLYFKDFKNQIIRQIQEKIESIELEFNKLEPEELEKIKKFCEPIIIEINTIIDTYLNKKLLFN